MAEEGAAIPALIDAMESDHRYSRSVGFWRSYAFGRGFWTGSDVARQAIEIIWPPSQLVMVDPLFSFDQLRAVWKDEPAKRTLKSKFDAKERGINNWMLAGSEFPEIVSAVWEAPVSFLRSEHTDMLTKLLGNGLSDPRGTGEFSLFKVLVGTGSGRKRTLMDCYGWPIRGTKKAILLDGLTYKIEHRIRKATLDEVVGKDPGSGFYPGPQDYFFEFLPALLLIRGDVKAANTIMEEHGYAVGSIPRPLHHRLRIELAHALLEGRDKEGLELASRLAALEFVIEHEFPSTWAELIRGKEERGLALYKDMVRRVALGPTKLDLADLHRLPRADRIARLIKALDEVRGAPRSLDGPAVIESDPIFQALVAEGEVAIPDLITAYETDPRFSRVSGFWPMRAPNSIFFSVKDVASAAIRSIWPESRVFFRDPDTVVANLRAAWLNPESRERFKKPLYPWDDMPSSLSFNPRNLAPYAGFSQRAKVDWTPSSGFLPTSYIEDFKELLGNGLSDPRRAGPLSLLRSHEKGVMTVTNWNHEFYGWPIPGTKRAVSVDGLTREYLEIVRSVKSDDMVPPHIGGGAAWSIRNAPWPLLPGLFLLREEFAAVKDQTDKYDFQNLNLHQNLATSHRIAASQAIMDGDDKEALRLASAEVNIQTIWKVSRWQTEQYGSKADLANALRWCRAVADRVAVPPKPVDLKAIVRLPKPQRINALIAALDQVEGNRVTKEGYIGALTDPIVKALIKEGQDIVEPLLATWHSDERLSRSQTYLPYPGNQWVFTVSDVAMLTIQAVWPAGIPSAPPRPQTLSDYLARFQLHKGLTREEQELATLSDPMTSDRDFGYTIRRIIERGRRNPKSQFERMNAGLRSKTVQRIIERINTALVGVNGDHPSSSTNEMAAAMGFGRQLCVINEREGVLALKRLSQATSKFANPEARSSSFILRELGETVILLLEKGEPDAIEDYISLVNIQVQRGDLIGLSISPMIHDYGNNPKWHTAIGEFFRVGNSVPQTLTAGSL